MKTVFYLLSLIPSLMVFNCNDDSIWINFVGLAYVLLVVLFYRKTKAGRKIYFHAMRNIEKLNRKIGNL